MRGRFYDRVTGKKQCSGPQFISPAEQHFGLATKTAILLYFVLQMSTEAVSGQ